MTMNTNKNNFDSLGYRDLEVERAKRAKLEHNAGTAGSDFNQGRISLLGGTNTFTSETSRELDRLRNSVSTSALSPYAALLNASLPGAPSSSNHLLGFESQLLRRDSQMQTSRMNDLSALNMILQQPSSRDALTNSAGSSTTNNARPTTQDALQSLLLQERLRNNLASSINTSGGRDLSSAFNAQNLLQLSRENQDSASSLSNNALLNSILSRQLGSQPGLNSLSSFSSSMNTPAASSLNDTLISNLLGQLQASNRQQLQSQLNATENSRHSALDSYLLQLQQLQNSSNTLDPLTRSLLYQQQQQQSRTAPHSSLTPPITDRFLPQSTSTLGLVSAASRLDERVQPTGATLTAAALQLQQHDAKLAATSYEGDRIVPLVTKSEKWVMSEYQSLLREQIVYVESNTTASRNEGKTQGRNKPIVQGQVGIMCKYCARLPGHERPRGAMYYPARLHRIYQAAQNMSHNHFAESCRAIPHETRERLMALKEQKAVTVGAGKEYWQNSAVEAGVREGENGLFFIKNSCP